MSRLHDILKARAPKSSFVMTDVHALDFMEAGFALDGSNPADNKIVNKIGYFESENADGTQIHRAIVILNNPALLDDFRKMFFETTLVKPFDQTADHFTSGYNIINNALNKPVLELEFERLNENAEKHDIGKRNCQYLARIEADMFGVDECANVLRAWLGAAPEKRTTKYTRGTRSTVVTIEKMIANAVFNEIGPIDLKQLENLSTPLVTSVRPVYVESGKYEASDAEYFVAQLERLRQAEKAQLAA